MKIHTKQIDKAAENLKLVAINTPLQLNKHYSEKYEANIYIKREDLQEVRSFKIRGAYNKISSLSEEERKKGVVCASAGNHAQGVAYSCSRLKIKGAIFMPAITPNQKLDKVKKFGGKYTDIHLIGHTFDEAFAASQEYQKKTGAEYIHPFNDLLTIAGQGTIGKEIYEKLEGKIDYLVASIGGGGLISGVSNYLKEKNDKVKIIGAEPKGAASMYQSLKNKKITTLREIDPFVDGAAVKTPGNITFEICKKNVSRIIPVEEGQVCTTMIDLYQNEGIVAEPAGTLSISSLEQIKDQIKGKNVVCVLSGGNNDILRYPEILERSLVWRGLKHYFIIEFAQKPGQLKEFLNSALGPDDDIVRFEYIKKTNKEKGPALVGIELRNQEDLNPLLKRMEKIELNFRQIRNDDVMYDYLV
jgi:threonine dehydratase